MKTIKIIAAICAASLLLPSCLIFNISDSYLHAGNYSVGAGSTTVAVSQLDIDWVTGDVNIQYADQSDISWTETVTRGVTDCHTQMHYWVDGSTLRIHFCESGTWNTNGALRKDLTITLPKGYQFDQVEIDHVSGNISADVDARQMEIETVSGDIFICNLRPAEQIEVDAVSGNTTIQLPENVAFSADFSSISGNMTSEFALTMNNDSYTYSPYSREASICTQIEVSTVSGNLLLKKYVAQ